MNFTLKSSLERRALVQVTFMSWLHDVDSLLKFASPGETKRRIKWQEVEGNVLKNVAKLRLPAVLIEKLSDLVEPIGRHILMWKEYHDKLLNINICKEILGKLCWTPYGTVDNKKTAEVLIKERSLDTYSSYKLACTYCIELDIHRLGRQVDPICLQHSQNETQLVSFWNRFLRGDLTRYGDFADACDAVLRHSTMSGNETALRYFVAKIALGRRECLEKLFGSAVHKLSISSEHNDFPKKLYAGVLCFLLSSLNKDIQPQMFKRCSRGVLMCLLDWPWQELFLETATYLETLFSEDDFYCLLTEISDRVVGNYIDHKYQEIFETFWLQRDVSYRKYVIFKCTVNGHLLSSLLRVGDKKNVELILKDASIVEREDLIFSFTGKSICDNLIGDNWDLLKFFIGSCISSADAAKQFEDEMKVVYISSCTANEVAVLKLGMWDKVFTLLKEIAQSCKRTNGEDDVSAAKEVCEVATCS